MKYLSPAPVLVSVLLAGGFGYSLGRWNTGAGQDGPTPVAKVGRIASDSGSKKGVVDIGGAAVLSSELAKLLSPEGLTNAKIGETVFRSLEEPDRARRMAAVGILLESMTPENAEAVRQSFIEITKKTGRQHSSEWSMMMRQYGKVLGARAWSELKGLGAGDRASAMEGWASQDPAAAQAALGKDDPEYSQIRSAMLAGITQKDPEMGFRLAVEDPSGYHSGWLMESGIQTLGIDGARVALQKVMDGVGESAAQNPAVSMLYRGLTEAMFHQKWTAGESEKMLPWLEAQKGQPLLQDSLIDHGAKDVVMQGKLDVALDWLDRMNEGREQGRAGGFGVLNGLLENPGQLATLDHNTLDRVVGLTTSQNGMTERLAGLLEKVSPDHAARLRALPGARRPAGFSPGVPMTTPGH